MVPLGLKNTFTKFQRIMDKILTMLDNVQNYIDDIIIFNVTMQEHEKHLQGVFEQLED